MSTTMPKQQESRPAASEAIRPFTIHFPDEELADLKSRVAARHRSTWRGGRRC